MPPRKGAVNRRGAARREQILDAAVDLFARRGYRGTGLLELAERVGLTHAGILHHFGTKQDLLRAVMARRDAELVKAAHEFRGKGIFGLRDVREIPESETLTRLGLVMRAESLDPDAPLHDYFDERDRATRDLIAGELRRGQDAGEIRADIDPDVKATEILAFNIGLETQWLLNPAQIDRPTVFRSYLRALLDDLTRPDAPRRPPNPG
ncbi:TetR/AcrR family transcriptional regulator [Frankia sp. CNm7]|uniref:TetR/AcrR family transcriptional regulator n=2 Tax=Frankia nepalensis TaxID=1836974 RepID=A0A937RF56_9ACTN|nr:TetR/AcrR family transcriptional regulator [Frankia nepalensis]MBL7514157.1 TetR/AcrR family transcriptional regulator [Frankia nepalensis]MBL7521509.1 TetR/AcrR family transcriptional regulator [Frankia nepalensis]MBL7628887.1 TetR/AcrR family transcriptional regulator [Frankia nepalensis]